MNDYERIAGILRHLDQSAASQPDLASLANRAGLSPFHFHRLFSSWAGVTPKDFLQCLTLAHAKKQLREGKSVLDTALDSGLSGPGRLHDLCVQLEAASPGELKSGGEGWRIRAGFADSPFGTCLIGESPRGICHLSFMDSGKKSAKGGSASVGKDAWAAIQRDWPRAELNRDDAHAAKLAVRIFKRAKSNQAAGGSSPLHAFVKGTEFQVSVWKALLKIPQGKFITYGQLAAALGKPEAARAVGSAVGKNPVGYLIPCHRVIRGTGVTGDYRWGRIRKRAILTWESTRNSWSEEKDKYRRSRSRQKNTRSNQSPNNKNNKQQRRKKY